MAYDTYIKLYTKADDKMPTKRFILNAAARWLMRGLEFRNELDRKSYYMDKYVELSKEELLGIVREYVEFTNLAHLKQQAREAITEIESDTTDYEKYQIHLAEWD